MGTFQFSIIVQHIHVFVVYKLTESENVKLHIIYRIHAPSGNRLTSSYFYSVTGYDMLASFTGLIQT